MKVSHVFNILRELPKIFLLKAFPLASYKGIINKQISLYNKLRKLYPETSENELLNALLISRIETWPRVAPKEVEYAHYTPLFQRRRKKLKDVIWAIIEWECILSRQEYVFDRLSKMGLSPWEVSEEIERFRWQVVGDIEESIEKKVKKEKPKVYKEKKEMGTNDQYKKIWHDILRKSKGISKDIADKFLIADNINPLKFKENHDYYIMDRYGDHKPTPSCFHPLDLPLGYPYWFASAYPDVVKYFATVPDEELMRLYADMGFTKEEWEDYDNPEVWELNEQGVHSFSVEVLYKLKEHYKKLYPKAKLECQ